MTAATKPGGVPLYLWMLGGFLIGVIAGLWVNLTGQGDAPWVAALTENVTTPLGQIFLRLLFMLVIPLLFSAIVMGMAEMGDLSALGRIGWKTLLLTIIISTLAVVIGLVAVNLLQPGIGLDPSQIDGLVTDATRDRAAGIVEGAPASVNLSQFFLDLIPSNVITAAAENQILPVMVFAIFFGIGLVMIKSNASDDVQRFIGGVFEVMMKLIGLVIRAAPIAVACFMFNLTAQFGGDLLLRLAAYVGVALLAMGIHMFVVYPICVAVLGGKNPLAFFAQVREPMLVAFSTASSNATLPISLRAAETELKLPRKIARFVLTVGATANQNGTALFEGVTVLFLAQLFGIDLSLQQQIVVMLVCILGGIGTAGVPAGSLPVVAMILTMVGVPAAGIGLILGVDRFLDMCRTTLNVTGDLVIAQIASRGETDPAVTPPEPFMPNAP
jgi:DAACS family dicarboxylate/amino acid:cation (Na+ or H+) symporter